jgi:hypothetical protein
MKFTCARKLRLRSTLLQRAYRAVVVVILRTKKNIFSYAHFSPLHSLLRNTQYTEPPVDMLMAYSNMKI